MLTEEARQKLLNESEDMKLAVDGMRAVFCSNGKIQPKHQRALDALARFCKIRAHNHGDNKTEILRITGRREVYNYILLCLEYSPGQRRKLTAQIKELENNPDGKRTSNDDTE